MSEPRNQIFISYASSDREWMEKLQVFLKPLVRSSSIYVWEDSKILPGQEWQKEVKSALEKAKVAVLLVSPNFLASDFINNEELPVLLNAAKNRGLVFFWIPLSYCLYEETEIRNYQPGHDPSAPLDTLPEPILNKALVEICNKIKRIVSGEKEEELPLNPFDANLADKVPEIAPDDWFSGPTKGGLFGKFKKYF